MDNLTTTITALSVFTFGQVLSPAPSQNLLASHQMSLDNRYEDRWVNDIFKDNILLNLAYFRGAITNKSQINWDEVRKPFIFEFRLNPTQVFAFHDNVLEKYRGRVNLTSNAHFNAQEGFKSDGYLFGDGVCHLASLVYWVAKDAALDAEAPTRHDFARIPDIERENGVSIISMPWASSSSQLQNLYITNNRLTPITFRFEYMQSLRPDGLKDDILKVSALELN